MAEERRAPSKHRIVLEQRGVCSVTGVLDVISFDEECVVADTECGVIVIKGGNVHVSNLNLDNGSLDVEGELDSIMYEDSGAFGKNKGSFLGKIFK